MAQDKQSQDLKKKKSLDKNGSGSALKNFKKEDSIDEEISRIIYNVYFMRISYKSRKASTALPGTLRDFNE